MVRLQQTLGMDTQLDHLSLRLKEELRSSLVSSWLLGLIDGSLNLMRT
jgi:hypothetical protein